MGWTVFGRKRKNQNVRISGNPQNRNISLQQTHEKPGALFETLDPVDMIPSLTVFDEGHGD